jgi:hypothetical protein
VAEGLRWTEIGIYSIFRILQGTVRIVFGVAIAKSIIVSRWNGGEGVFAVAATVIAGMGIAHVQTFPESGRSGRRSLDDDSLPVAGNPSYFMCRKTTIAARIITKEFTWKRNIPMSQHALNSKR